MRTLIAGLSFVVLFPSAAYAERDQVGFTFDYDTPGVYQLKVAPSSGKAMCWITFNEYSGNPRSRSTRGNWQYYRVLTKDSDYSGVVEVTVPCPNGSVSISNLVEVGRKEVSDNKGGYLTLIQKQLQGCIGGNAWRKGDWVVVQADSKSQCLSGSEMDAWGHPVGFERW